MLERASASLREELSVPAAGRAGQPTHVSRSASTVPARTQIAAHRVSAHILRLLRSLRRAVRLFDRCLDSRLSRQSDVIREQRLEELKREILSASRSPNDLEQAADERTRRATRFGRRRPAPRPVFGTAAAAYSSTSCSCGGSAPGLLQVFAATRTAKSSMPLRSEDVICSSAA